MPQPEQSSRKTGKRLNIVSNAFTIRDQGKFWRRPTAILGYSWFSSLKFLQLSVRETYLPNVPFFTAIFCRWRQHRRGALYIENYSNWNSSYWLNNIFLFFLEAFFQRKAWLCGVTFGNLRQFSILNTFQVISKKRVVLIILLTSSCCS